MNLTRRQHEVYDYIRSFLESHGYAPSLEEILGWIASGDLSLTIGATYPLEKAAEAHADLEGRKTTGKLVLKP